MPGRARKVKVLKALDQALTAYIAKAQQDEVANWLSGVKAPKAWLEVASKALPVVEDDVAGALRSALEEYISRMGNVVIPDGLEGEQLKAALVEELRTKMFNNNAPMVQAFNESLQGLEQVFVDAADAELIGLLGDTGVVFGAKTQLADDAAEFMASKKIITTSALIKTNESLITAALSAGIAGGDTMDQMAKALEDSWGFGRGRAYLIARTEVIAACNAGTHAGYKNSGVVAGSEWVSSGDGRVRHTHAIASGQRRKLGEPFIVGGYELMYPGDSSLGASAREVVRCRCTTVPILIDPEVEENSIWGW